MLSEIDINDWERTEPKKLHDIESKTPIELNNSLYWFDHLDGMYSYCLDYHNNIVHIAAFQLVTPFRKK